MPEMPAIGGSWAQDYGAVTASSIGTAVTAAGSANTKGTVVELIASTAHDAHWVSVSLVSGPTVNPTNGFLDLLIGASTEATLIANLPVTQRAVDEGGSGPYLFPLFIPKGSRLAAAYQSSTASGIIQVVVHLYGGNPAGPWADCAYVDRYGATTTSRGTNVDPGGVANTYIANYVEITAATLRPIRWLLLCAQSQDQSIATATQWTVRLGIGAATEAQIGGDLILTTGPTLDNVMPFMHWYFPVYIPTGSRLAVNAKCSNTTDTERDLYISIFGAG